MYDNIFIHSPIEEHLGCLYVLTTMIKVILKIHMDIWCEHKFSIHVEKFQKLWLLEYLIEVYFLILSTEKVQEKE